MTLSQDTSFPRTVTSKAFHYTHPSPLLLTPGGGPGKCYRALGSTRITQRAGYNTFLGPAWVILIQKGAGGQGSLQVQQALG